MNKLLNNISDCIKICQEEIEKRNNGIKGESTLEQLENVILPELNKLFNQLKNDSIPLQKDRYLTSFAYAFKIWGWDMQKPTELFILLQKINDTYKNL